MTPLESRKQEIEQKDMKKWLLMRTNTWYKGEPCIAVKWFGKTYAVGMWFVKEIPF